MSLLRAIRAVLAVAGLATVAAFAAPPPSLPKEIDLPAAIGLALENNFAIRQAREQIRQQEGIALVVQATAMPTVTSAATVQHSHVSSFQTTPVPSFTPEGRFWRLTLTANQTLFAGGGVRASIQGAQLEREAAILNFQQAVNAALLQTRTRFYDVLLAREMVTVQQESLRLLESVLADTSHRAEAGTISEFERLRAEVAVANAKPPLIRAQNDYRLAIEELRLAVGIPHDRSSVGQEPEFVGKLTFEPHAFDLQKSLDIARISRPDLRRLAKLTEALEQSVAAARAPYYPQLSATAGADLRTGATEKLSDSVNGARGSLQGRANIFDRAIAGRVTQAESKLAQARLTAAEASFAAELEIRRALSDIEQTSELANATRQTVAQAEEAARLARARYDVGAAVQLDVLKAQVDLTATRSSALRAHHGFNVAVARLRAGMGFADVDYDSSGTSGPPPIAKQGLNQSPP